MDSPNPNLASPDTNGLQRSRRTAEPGGSAEFSQFEVQPFVEQLKKPGNLMTSSRLPQKPGFYILYITVLGVTEVWI